MAFTAKSLQLLDRARSTSTGTGTGSLALGAGISGYEPLENATYGDEPFGYVIAHRTADEWEVGIGHLAYSGSYSLVRDRVLNSSSGGNVSFSAGTKDIFVTAPAALLEHLKHPTHNLLINGGFDFFQRQAPGTATARSDDTYGPDRWYVLTQTAAVNCERVAASMTSLHTSWSKNAVKLTQNQATAQRFGLAQIVEATDSHPLRGRTAIFQGKIKISNSQSIKIAVLEWTGTADAVTSDFVLNWGDGAMLPGNFFIASNVAVAANDSITPPANEWFDFELRAPISTSANNVIVAVWSNATAAQNFTLELTQCGLHHGTERRDWMPRLSAEEEFLCQRFCQRIGDDSRLRGILLSPIVYAFCETTPMRVTPTLAHNISAFQGGFTPGSTELSFFNIVTGANVTITGGMAGTPVVFDSYSHGKHRVYFQAGTSFSGSQGNEIMLTFGASAAVVLDAEL